METTKKTAVKWAAIALATGVGICALAWYSDAFAADLGGNCCSDLEERIAELEATTAKKGNRKMSLTVYGEVNKALLWYDADIKGSESFNGSVDSGSASFKDQNVIDNSNAPTFLGLAGSAPFAKDWKAGYVLEVGLGGRDEGGTNEVYLHRSFVYVGGPVGTISLGHASQATDNLDMVSTANTDVAQRPLSLRPLTGPQVGEVLDLFDGNRADVIRYDSPSIGGFIASASWASGGENNEDAWDLALRYAGEFSGFRVMAAGGYRNGIVINGGGASFVVPDGNIDLDTWTVVASVMHVTSGLFITGNYGDGQGDVIGFESPVSGFDLGAHSLDTRGWAVTAGIENKFLELGKTTFYGEYGDVEVEAKWSGLVFGADTTNRLDVGISYWGLGVIQNFQQAATDVYATVRFYDADLDTAYKNAPFDVKSNLNVDATVGTVGARVKF